MAAGQLTQFGRPVEVQAPGLLIQEASGTGRTSRVGFKANIVAPVIQPDQTEFFSPHHQDRAGVRVPLTDGGQNRNLIVDSGCLLDD